MNTPSRLGAYVLGLVVVFGGALGAGTAVGPVDAAASDHGSDHSSTAPGGTAMEHGHRTSGVAGTHKGGHAGKEAGAVPGGLAVSQDGYTLIPAQGTLPAGRPVDFRFTITGPDGQPVTRYIPEHDKDLHLIVVRRDLSGFQHLHPALGADGTWSVPLTLPAAGDHRVFADFVPAAEGARPLTLGVDLHAAGDYSPAALPEVARTATVDGYTVTLDGDLQAGTSSELTLWVSKGGQPVTNLQPYLAAYGHLVALRDGDLAYLHVHPEGSPGDGSTPAGPQVRFTAEVATAGTYRLYLDFQHQGVVRTVEFTATAPRPAASEASRASATVPAPAAPHGGDEQVAGHSH